MEGEREYVSVLVILKVLTLGGWPPATASMLPFDARAARADRTATLSKMMGISGVEKGKVVGDVFCVCDVCSLVSPSIFSSFPPLTLRMIESQMASSSCGISLWL